MDNTQNERKKCANLYLIRNLYLKYTKNFYHSVIKRQITQFFKKWSKDLNRIDFYPVRFIQIYTNLH